MNQNKILKALDKILQEVETLPASDQATKCSLMITELSGRIRTKDKYPASVPPGEMWIDNL